MQITESLETLLENELRVLCSTCTHANTCLSRRNTSKKIIQCDVFESDKKNAMTGIVNEQLAGLCLSCNKAHECNLPARQFGVFRCTDYV